MKWGKAEGFSLIVCVMFSLFVSVYRVRIASGPGSERPINVYAVDIGDSPSCWIGSDSAVRDGISAAISDADTKTKVKLAGETINYEVVNNFSRLEQLVNNPPEQAVFVNAHGETVPMSGNYFGPYVHVESPSDGETINGTVTGMTVTVEATIKTLADGALNETPYVLWGTPGNLGTSRLQMTLIDWAHCRYRAYIQPHFTDEYEICVKAATSQGLATCATVNINFIGVAHAAAPSGGGGGWGYHFPIPLCPYVYAWNGAGFAEDNNVLLGSNGSAVDCYRLEKPLVAGVDGNYSLRLSESADKRDLFDSAQLLAVDHADNVNVGVDADGTILTYGVPASPSSALLGGCCDVGWWVKEVDGGSYPFEDGDWLDVRFAGLNVSLGAKLVLRMRADSENTVLVQRFNVTGESETVGAVRPRGFWSTQVLNVSGLLPDPEGDCKLRLVFEGNCSVDFVGLDTTANADVTVSEGELVSVDDSTGIKATFGDLQCEDGVCAMLRHGYTFDMRFRLPMLNDSGLRRDFIFLAKGYYIEEGDGVFAGLGGGGASDIVVDWKDWFEKIENCCRTMGWVWANVAGYSFYYFGNNEYESIRAPGYDPNCPREAGLKQFLNKDVTCEYYGEHRAELSYGFVERTGFDPLKVYQDLPVNVTCQRPFATMNLMWNTVGYVDEDDGKESHVTASVTMNGTDPGIFVHSGLAGDADMDGLSNMPHDDYLKGYIATVLAIEEARAFLLAPQYDSRVVGDWYHGTGNNDSAAFTVSMVPGGWGVGEGDFGEAGYHHYRYVDLRLGLAAAYKDYFFCDSTSGYFFDCALSVNDFMLSGSNPEVWGEVMTTMSGWEIGGTSTAYNSMYGWWALSQTIAAFGGPYYVGLGRSMVPLFTSPPDTLNATTLNSSVNTLYVNGTLTDKDHNEKGAMSFYFRMIFFYDTTDTPRNYSFTLNIVSWIRWTYYMDPFKLIWMGEKTRAEAISTVPMQLEFEVTG